MATNEQKGAAGAAAASLTGGALAAGRQVHHRFEQVGDVKVFYRVAGDRRAPAVLLLHGYAASRSCTATSFRCLRTGTT
jgi:hypothetical protein